jgi:hypothetical protein
MLPVYAMRGRGRLAHNIKPVCDIGGTTRCWTCQQKTAALIATNVDLPPAEYLLTDNTNALVIERLPFPQLVRCAKNIETLFGREAVLHFAYLIEEAK